MGWCQEFGAVIHEGCGHGMVAEPDHCQCPVCGVRCPGKFDACKNVWANGAAPVSLSEPSSPPSPAAPPAVAPQGVSSLPAAPPVTEPVIPSSRTAAVSSSSAAASGDDHHGLDQLRRMVAALPHSIRAVLAEARQDQHHDLAATADQLAVVLAKRVAAEVDRFEAARTTPLAESLAELTASVQALHDRLDALEPQPLTDTRVR